MVARRKRANTRPAAGVWIIDTFIRFVARDSRGRCFLWSMHCGEAGYGCQIATLTDAEERALYEWAVHPAEKIGVARRPRPPLAIEDRTPVSGSFVDSQNALRFFSKNGDPELTRWARIMFEKVHGHEHSD
jgi:hypothetical protein